MAEPSDPGHAVERHERTSEPDLNRLQPGWKVRDRTGSELGRVVERDDESFVMAGSPADERTRVPLQLVAHEDHDGQTVTLTVDGGDLPD